MTETAGSKPHTQAVAQPPWRSPMPEADARKAASNLFRKKDAEGWITGDGQRVMLTADEVVQLIACYWEADSAN